MIPDFGCMDTNICIWSGHASASNISTPFHSHNFLMICPMSPLLFPYITCLRYFRANTMWYLQFNVVCAILFVSIFILTPHIFFVLEVARPIHILP